VPSFDPGNAVAITENQSLEVKGATMKAHTSTYIATLVVVLSSAIAGCTDDALTTDDRNVYVPDAPQALIVGTVEDVFGNAIPGAIIQISEDIEVIADVTGSFEAEVELDDYSLQLHRSGYVGAYRQVAVERYAYYYVDFQLLPVGQMGEFDAAQGTAVEIGDAVVSLQASAFEHADGTPDTGQVDYQMTYISADDFDAMSNVPALGSLDIFGVIEAEFFANGELVNLASGREATVVFEVAGLDKDLTEVDLFHFDPALQEWTAESTATVTHEGSLSIVTGLLPHFSKWGAGKPGKVDICHIPGGNPFNAHTINISVNAADSHIENHGDYLGSCEELFDVIDACDAEAELETCDPSYVECHSDAMRLVNVRRSLYILRIIFGEWSGHAQEPSPNEYLIDFCDDLDHGDYDDYFDDIDPDDFASDDGDDDHDHHDDGECVPDGGPEVCDGIDNDCDGIVDNQDQVCLGGSICVATEDGAYCIAH